MEKRIYQNPNTQITFSLKFYRIANRKTTQISLHSSATL
jgi:hypothetical protein